MVCSLCGRRQARRACPALGHQICSVCCGTKREIEINCPSSCQHLAASRTHPAAVVRRQQEDDLRTFLPTIRDLSSEQEELITKLLLFVRDYRPSTVARGGAVSLASGVGDMFTRVTDDDVEAAAGALAATFETAAKGLIYEQRPASLPAQRLADDFKSLLAQLDQAGGSSADRNLASAFRAIERGAREARKTLPGGNTAYLAMLKRLLVAPEPAGASEASRLNGASGTTDKPSGLIIPG